MTTTPTAATALSPSSMEGFDNHIGNNTTSAATASLGVHNAKNHAVDDEQLARDLQMAYDLQEREDRKAAAAIASSSQKKKSSSSPSSKKNNSINSKNSTTTSSTSTQFILENDGFVLNQLNADDMLFVTCEIDGRLVEMLIDSGAGASAMTTDMVFQLGLQSKLNTSIVGNCSGVGSANIVGVVENVSCILGDGIEFRLFFMVLDSSLPSVVFGLDQLKRFHCIIDLEEHYIQFGGKSGIAIPFLPPELAKQAAARLTTKSSSQQQSQYAQSQQNRSSHHQQPLGGRGGNNNPNTSISSWTRNLFGR